MGCKGHTSDSDPFKQEEQTTDTLFSTASPQFLKYHRISVFELLGTIYTNTHTINNYYLKTNKK